MLDRGLGQVEGAAEELERRPAVLHSGDAPAGRAAEEAAQGAVPQRLGPGHDRQAPGARVPLGTGQGDQHAPAGQRPGVVVAALRLVPRVASDAVVTVADGADHLQALVDEPVVDQVGGDLVLDAAPHLVAVHERDSRSTAAGPGAQHQTLVVVERVRPLHAVVVAEVATEVVREDRADRLPDVLGRRAGDRARSGARTSARAAGRTGSPRRTGSGGRRRRRCAGGSTHR